MASTTLHVAVPRARAVASRARRGGMPPARPASRRGVRCAAGEEVPLGVQIETALMDAFAPRFVGDRARAHPERPLSTRRLETAASRHPNPPRSRNPCMMLFLVDSLFLSFSDEVPQARSAETRAAADPSSVYLPPFCRIANPLDHPSRTSPYDAIHRSYAARSW